MNYSSFNASIFSPHNVPTILAMQYGAMRYKCFTKDDPYVALNHRDQTEFDHFDQDSNTHYIMVYTTTNGIPTELMSAVRIRSTLADYELEMPSYRYLTHSVALPKDHTIYEGSRWVGKSSRTSEGKLSTAMLLSRLYHLSHALNFNEIIGTISTLSENWLAKRSAQADRESHAYHSERDKLDILVSRIQVDERFLDMANTLFKSALMEFNFEQICVAQPAIKRAA